MALTSVCSDQEPARFKSTHFDRYFRALGVAEWTAGQHSGGLWWARGVGQTGDEVIVMSQPSSSAALERLLAQLSALVT